MQKIGIPAHSVQSPLRPVAGIEDCVTGIDHIAVAVIDLDEAVEWYTRILGFRVVEDERVTKGAHTAMRSVVVSAGTALVVLLQGTCPKSPISRFIEEFGAGVHHVALNVTNIDDVARRFSAKAAAADTPVLSDEGLRQVFLRRDPGSGVRLELIERHGGTFSEKSVEELFRNLEASDLY